MSFYLGSEKRTYDIFSRPPQSDDAKIGDDDEREVEVVDDGPVPEYGFDPRSKKGSSAACWQHIVLLGAPVNCGGRCRARQCHGNDHSYLCLLCLKECPESAWKYALIGGTGKYDSSNGNKHCTACHKDNSIASKDESVNGKRQKIGQCPFLSTPMSHIFRRTLIQLFVLLW